MDDENRMEQGSSVPNDAIENGADNGVTINHKQEQQQGGEVEAVLEDGQQLVDMMPFDTSESQYEGFNGVEQELIADIGSSPLEGGERHQQQEEEDHQVGVDEHQEIHQSSNQEAILPSSSIEEDVGVYNHSASGLQEGDYKLMPVDTTAALDTAGYQHQEHGQVEGEEEERASRERRRSLEVGLGAEEDYGFVVKEDEIDNNDRTNSDAAEVQVNQEEEGPVAAAAADSCTSRFYWETEGEEQQGQGGDQDIQDEEPPWSYAELSQYVENLYGGGDATPAVEADGTAPTDDGTSYQEQQDFISNANQQDEHYATNVGMDPSNAMEAGLFGQDPQQQQDYYYQQDQETQPTQQQEQQQQPITYKTKSSFRPPSIFTSQNTSKVYVDDGNSETGGGGGGGHIKYNANYWDDPSEMQDPVLQQEETDDEYEDENLGDDFDETPWVPPSHERAMSYREIAIFEGGHANLCGKVGLRNMGAGVKLHFNLLKALIIGYFLLLLLNVPALNMYSSGMGIKKEARDFLGLYSVTLGNMMIPSGDHYVAQLGSHTLSLKSAAGILSAMDILACLVFVGIIVFISRGVSSIKKQQKVLTTKDYSVFVTNLPKNVDKEQIIQHFSKLYPLNQPDWKGRPPPLGKEKKPVIDVCNTSDDRYLGSWIAEVAIARRMGFKLRTILSNEEKTRKLKRYRAHMKMYAPTTPLLDGNGADEVQYSKYQELHDALGGEIDTIAEKLNANEEMVGVERDCVGAFIVFEYPEGRRRCLEDYSSMNLRQLFRFPESLLFKGRRLVVKPAPDPEDVWWENLEVSSWDRFFRRGVVNFMMTVVLIISFLSVILLSQAKQTQKENTPKFSLCDTEIPALFLGSYANVTRMSSQLQFLQPDPFACPTCDIDCTNIFPASTYATYTTHNDALVTPVPYDYAACSDPCPSATKTSQCPCADSKGKTQCHTLACTKPTAGHTCQTFYTSTVGGCYCYDKFNSAGWWSVFSILHNDSFCQGLIRIVIVGVILQIILAVSTLAINGLLTLVIHKLTYFEYNDSSDTEASQLMIKIFISQFVNTAILLLLVYGRLKSDQGLARVVKTLGILSNEYSDFTVDWYATVGTQLSLTALIAAVSPHVAPLFQYFVLQPMQQRRAMKALQNNAHPKFVMQHDLNVLFVGPRFDIVQRSGSLLNTLFFSFTYSSGLPIMLLFALLSFVLSYIIDRVLLLRFYRRPPQRDERLHRKICNCLPYALLLHLSIAIWMFGSGEIFGAGVQGLTDSVTNGKLSGSSSLAAKIGHGHVIPLFLGWLILVVYIIFKDVLPSYYVASMLSNLKEAVEGLWASQHYHRFQDPKMDNGYTKIYEVPLPANYAATAADDPTWGVFKNDDGASVLRRLKSPTATSPKGSPKASSPKVSSPKSPTSKLKTPKSPDGAGRSTCRRTWEVIRQNGLWTYALDRHPKYREAVTTFLREFSPTSMGAVNHSKKGKQKQHTQQPQNKKQKPKQQMCQDKHLV